MAAFTRNEARTIDLIQKVRARPSTKARRSAIRRYKVKLLLYRTKLRAAAAATGWGRSDRRARYHGLLDVYKGKPISPGAAPKIIDADLSANWRQGPLGRVHFVTGHHAAGPTDKSDADALRLVRQFHAQHRRKFGDGLGYHFNLARSGSVILGRPTAQKGAHVGQHNTGNVGVLCHGTTGDKPTAAQAASLAWLLANAHTSALPASHRIDLRSATVRGHKDWPGHASNACPGTHHRMYLTRGKDR